LEDNVCDRCGGRLTQREDDREETVRHRLDVYHSLTQPLLAFYEDRGLLREIDAHHLPGEGTDAAMQAPSRGHQKPAWSGRDPRADAMIEYKSPSEIEKMRRAGAITAHAVERLLEVVEPGMTTAQLDEIAEQSMRAEGATPSFKGYKGFPASICTSLNDEV